MPNIFDHDWGSNLSSYGRTTRQMNKAKRLNRPHRKAIKQWRETRKKPLQALAQTIREHRRKKATGDTGATMQRFIGDGSRGGDSGPYALETPKAQKLNKGGIVRHKNIYDMEKGG